jgi:hypothetical protein
MAKRSSSTQRSKNSPTRPPATDRSARSLRVARKGISTGADFAAFMSGLMSDLIEGKVPPQVGNATCNAGGKLLKVVEMQYKYGTPGRSAQAKTLVLAP